MSIVVDQLYHELGADIVARMVDAIRNKPIPRKGQRGQFSAVVNASGALADSVEYRIEGYKLEVLANDYWITLVYGRAPGSIPPVDKIAEWLAIKNINASPSHVALNIGYFGSTIWQQFQGEDSGLFSDVLNAELMDEMSSKLANEFITEIEITLPKKI